MAKKKVGAADAGATDAAAQEWSTRDPDAPPEELTAHAERLAQRVRRRASELKKVKLAAGTADKLDALAKALRQRQTAWLQAHATLSAKELKALRKRALKRRGDLFHGLRYFARKDATVQRALDAIAAGSGDADLVQDLASLGAIARKQKRALAGTDVTPQVVAEAVRYGNELRVTLAGKDADPAVQAAHAARNEAFWALADVAREASAAGRYAFRRQPGVAALFGAYRAHASVRAHDTPSGADAASTPGAPVESAPRGAAASKKGK